MVQAINQIIVLLWIPQLTHQLLIHLYWWQTKEYRFDRLWSFIKESAGRQELMVYTALLKFFLLVLAARYQNLMLLVGAFFLYLDAVFLLAIVKQEVRRPIFTQRARRVFLLTVIAQVVFGFWISFNFSAIRLLLAELLGVIMPAVGIGLTQISVVKAKKAEMAQAQAKLAKIKPLIIGITGSYGKTTTKDFVTHLLSKNYKTEKTKENQNTDFGIIRKINTDLKTDTEVFVVEMGAYKRGDIKRLCSITRPKLGVITGIEPQHLDLFGGLENIKLAKYELIENLDKGAPSFFNLNSAFNRDLHIRAVREKRENVFGYYVGEPSAKLTAGNVAGYARITSADENGVHFVYYEKGKRCQLFAPLAGEHFVENLTGAIAVARYLKVGFADIKKLCKTINHPEDTMAVKQLDYGAILVDNSHNANPRGFLAAVDYLKYFKGKKKLVVTSGIIELGRHRGQVHSRIADKLSVFCDAVILTNSSFAKYFRQKLDKKGQFEVIKDPKKLVAGVEVYLEKGYVILLEGRMPAKLMKFINNRTK